VLRGIWLMQAICAAGPTLPLSAQEARTAGTVGVAAITGVITDSAGTPVRGATVRTSSGQPRTVTDSLGGFRLDSVPAGAARVQVAADGYLPLGFEFEIAPNVTVSLKLTVFRDEKFPLLPPQPRDAFHVVDGDSAEVGIAILRGTVRDSDGQPLSGVQIEAIGADRSTLTDASGRFRVTKLRDGAEFLRIRKIGFLPEYVPVQVATGRALEVSVKLRPAAAGQMLAKVTVRDDARLAGFYHRKLLGDGLFLTTDDLRKPWVTQLTDLLRARNGFDVVRDRQGQQIVYGRRTFMSRCPMGLVIDGMSVPLAGQSVDRVIETRDARAVEVYRDGMSVPAEFQSMSTECGAVIVWMR
jgi:hypothetical protein